MTAVERSAEIQFQRFSCRGLRHYIAYRVTHAADACLFARVILQSEGKVEVVGIVPSHVGYTGGLGEEVHADGGFVLFAADMQDCLAGSGIGSVADVATAVFAVYGVVVGLTGDCLAEMDEQGGELPGGGIAELNLFAFQFVRDCRCCRCCGGCE